MKQSKQEAVCEDRTFTGASQPDANLTDRNFSGCVFRACDFSNGRLVRTTFADCTFDGCNLSNIEIDGSRWQNVIFQNCKIMGLAWAKISPLLLYWEFRQCRIQLCNFSGLRMNRCRFAGSTVRESDFINVELRKASFVESDLQGSKFHHADLTEADFTNARNYFIDLNSNQVKNAVFTLPEVLNLLAPFGLKIEY